MDTVVIVIFVLAVLLITASIVLSRTTYRVQSANDAEYLELEGNWIRYRVAGGGAPVVLVHGWLSSGEIWERLAERLAQRFTVYTLDLTGFGESDKPTTGYGVRYGGRLLYAFCAHFGLTRAAVVGHDIGGAMAVKLAADHPDVVGRIVLVATPADEDQIDLPTFLWLATLPFVGPVFYALGRLLRPLRRFWMRAFVLDPADLTDEVVDDAGKSTPAAVAKTLGVMRRELARGRLARQAGVVKVPVLAIAGEEDQIVDPQATDDWARTVSAEVVLIEGCGHMPMLERSGEFDARVLAFLTGDQRYLGAPTGRPEEGAGREEEVAADTPGEPSSAAPAGPQPDTAQPEDRPHVVRKREGRYPPRDRGSGDTGSHQDPSLDQSASNGIEERSGRREDRAEGGVGPLPEMPKDLFQWPDSLKEARPWDRSRETGWPTGEEPGEDAKGDKDAKGDEEATPGEDPDSDGPREGPGS